MADTSVQGIGDYMSSFLKTDYPSSVAKAKSTKTSTDNSFDDVMAAGFSAVLSNFPANQVTELNRSNDLMSRISVNTQTDRTTAVKVNDNVRNIREKVTESSLEDAVHEAGTEMVRKVSEVLNVSEDTVTNAMETLDITEADLLNPETLSTLTTEITGETDTGLLTNDALYQDLQQLMDTASELTTALLDEFNLSDVQLNTAIENLSAGLNVEFVETVLINPEVSAQTGLFNRVEAPETAPEVQVDVDEEGAMVMQEEEMLPENGTGNLRPETENNAEENQTGSDTGRRETRETERVEFTNAFDQIASRLNDVSQTYADALQEAAEVPMEAPGSPEDILRQMTDFIRLEAKPEVTTMELSLHPASLGNVTVQISEAADGNMTARFLTQNDTVKAALEAQLVELQQRFDEQGLKVNEIQVTVESHAFEQNLQQGAGSEQERAFREQAGRTAPRRINLIGDAFDEELTDEMDEATRIAADMMARSGNRLDYQA